MKTLGLVGGTGWVSTVEYYRIINEEVNRRLGGLQFARCIVYSVNYGDIAAFNSRQNFDAVSRLITDAAVRITKAGAEGVVLCANTLHRYTESVEKAIAVPLIHIADATANELSRHGFFKVGLLGTKQTMELDFYTSRLNRKNIEVMVPEKSERDFIQTTIEQELLRSVFNIKSKERFKEIAINLYEKGCEAIVLGCTEIPLLLHPGDLDMPLIDTLAIHSKAAVDFALR